MASFRFSRVEVAGFQGSLWSTRILLELPLSSRGFSGLKARVSHALRLRRLLGEARARIIQTGVVPGRRMNLRDIPDIRSEVAQKLASAINEVDSIAKRSSRKTRKGSGGLPPKVRWYSLMAQLAQVLDGVLHNVSLNEIDDKLETLENSVEELQEKSQTS